MLKVACIGAGYFSQFHFDGWRRITGVDLVGITNRDRAKAEATGIPIYDNMTDLLARVQPDILDVIISPEGHADAIRTALKYPLKAIVCQKPFCTSIEEAEEIAALAAKANVPLVIHENFRFQPWFRAIKSQIDSGAIGQVQQATFRLRPGDGQGPDAYLARQPYFQKMPRFLVHETGVHYIDTFRYLFGDPTAIYADLRRVNPVIAGEDAGFVVFDHPGGVRAVLDGNRNLDHAATNTRCTMGEGLFEGTQGTLTLNGDGSVHLRAFGALATHEVLAPDTSPNFGGDCTHNLQAHVVNALTTGAPVENLVQEYLTVIRIEQVIYSSSENKCKVEI